MKERIEWIDILKGLGILSIVLTHAYIPETHVKKLFYSFHIPVFFFISGYLHKVELQKIFLNKRIKTLLIPYIFFYASSTLVYLFIQHYSASPDPSSLQFQRVLGLFYGVGDGEWMFNITLWFLPCLLVVALSYNLLLLYIKKTKIVIILLAIFSVVGYLGSLYLPFRMLWGVDVAISGIVFYGLGALLKNKVRFEKLLKNKNKLVIILLLLMINATTAFINIEVDMNSNVLGNYFLFYISSISGIAWILLLSKEVIRKSKFLEYFGKNSLIILGTHTVVLMLLPGIIKRVNGDSGGVIYQNDILINGVILFLITIIIEIPIIYIINRYFGFFLGRRL